MKTEDFVQEGLDEEEGWIVGGERAAPMKSTSFLLSFIQFVDFQLCIFSKCKVANELCRFDWDKGAAGGMVGSSTTPASSRSVCYLHNYAFKLFIVKDLEFPEF